ncbi:MULTISPECIES: sce7726 family protein [Polaromonas]|uniref:Sce7726 family protein n=1 Tax=Polaromonas aquatica TaxID=332657 RepID=A0ABW1U1P8_9BURK
MQIQLSMTGYHPVTIGENVQGDQLTDKEIRAVLVDFLKGRPVAPKAVLEEVRVHNGNAIADVVSIHNMAHCYEIKGETDAISRITRQGAFYDQAFQRITLVTTKNHERQAFQLAPTHWGVVVASKASDGTLMLRYMRKATDSPRFNKEVALLTLWKCELLALCGVEEKAAQKLSRANLTKMIATKTGVREVNISIAQSLLGRQTQTGWPATI